MYVASVFNTTIMLLQCFTSLRVIGTSYFPVLLEHQLSACIYYKAIVISKKMEILFSIDSVFVYYEL